MKAILVPLMLFTSSTFMSLAWIGHLRFRSWSFFAALLTSWLIVLPEYVLNVSAVRLGRDIYTGAEMASFHLCSGVVCVVLVSRLFLGETISSRQYAGFGLMMVALVLIVSKGHSEPEAPTERPIPVELQDSRRE